MASDTNATDTFCDGMASGTNATDTLYDNVLWSLNVNKPIGYKVETVF